MAIIRANALGHAPYTLTLVDDPMNAFHRAEKGARPRGPGRAGEPFAIHAVFPNYYDGTRVSYSLKAILQGLSSATVSTDAYVMTKARNVGSEVSALLPLLFYSYTSRLVRDPCASITRRFGHRFRPGDVAYFWMTNPTQLTRALQRKGLWVVREMINCTARRRRDELRRAYALLGMPDGSDITDAFISQERDELLAADAVFCPNELVVESVVDYGVSPSRCIRTSYGWAEARIDGDSVHLAKSPGTSFLFVGSADVRKGFPWLLQAWDRAGIEGRLLVAGHIDPAVRARFAAILNRPDVVPLGYVEDIGSVYRSADVFCFPSWEEGGPMVTIEAMGSGLPCIVTPMGSAGIVSDRSGGAIIVEPGNVDSMVAAMRRLAADKKAREAMGRRAREIAADFTWRRVGERRREAIVALREQPIRP